MTKWDLEREGGLRFKICHRQKKKKSDKIQHPFMIFKKVHKTRNRRQLA